MRMFAKIYYNNDGETYVLTPITYEVTPAPEGVNISVQVLFAEPVKPDDLQTDIYTALGAVIASPILNLEII